MPPAGASTGRPASSALVKVGADSGSTPTTFTVPANHAATPPMSPPPPTETSTVSTVACAASSMPRVPWPSKVSVWSYACTGSAAVRSIHALPAASASA